MELVDSSVQCLLSYQRSSQENCFFKVDVDELKDVANEWQVWDMPTFIFIKDGESIDRIVGANKEDLERKVASLSTEAVVVIGTRV